MLHTQNNNSCQTAAILNPVLECNSPQTFIFGNGQTEQWFSFTINNNVNTLAQNQLNNYQTGINLYSNMNAKVNVFKNNINQQGIPFGTGIIA
ncbi:MAG: hypothetical protein BroJett020_05420 [Bacteroidota bacterium]|nr:MAG: hypothetical protein BroJett020_05420 [Bacteroidota bacterium]